MSLFFIDLNNYSLKKRCSFKQINMQKTQKHYKIYLKICNDSKKKNRKELL